MVYIRFGGFIFWPESRWRLGPPGGLVEHVKEVGPHHVSQMSATIFKPFMKTFTHLCIVVDGYLYYFICAKLL